MGQRSPLVTLAATAVGLVAFLVVNSTQTGNPTTASNPAPTATPQGTVIPSESPTTPPPTVPQTPTKPASTAPAKPPAVYAGRTNEREASLAIATKGERAAAYVCDGRSLEAWLVGTYRNGQLVLRSKSGERLTAAITNNTATGTFTLSGRTLRFAIGKAAHQPPLPRAELHQHHRLDRPARRQAGRGGQRRYAGPGPAARHDDPRRERERRTRDRPSNRRR